MRVLHGLLAIAVAVGTAALLGPIFEIWKPPAQCRDLFGVQGMPLPSPEGVADPFLRLGIPSIDNQVCGLTKFFEECRDYPTPLVALLTHALIFSPAISVGLFVSVEATRKLASGPASWASFISFLSQYLGISFAIPAVWFPAFLYSYATPLSLPKSSKHAPTDVSLGSPLLLGFIGAMSALQASVFLYLGFARGPHYGTFFFVFQFLPIVVPWLWPLLQLVGRRPSSTEAASHASVAASQIYFTFAVFLALHHWIGFVAPLMTTPDATPQAILTTLLAFLREMPSTPQFLPTWFLLIDGLSLTLTSALVVASQQANVATAVLVFLGFFIQAIFLGSGATLMLFAGTREAAIRRVHFAAKKAD
ncbi:Aste57867_18190 [Aphanomyces stellatus]|uniref:Aste57867_18190 protein n=1 Tax=Aphanomyces stellatus TaxID=120398 RepID=A0A485LB55_9STRA|nr:hypothetical protein As57867_018128 [Aphanomyces stellatus]VFT94928.1 Aste57867_18190 [Aphanomyces stellatus]